MALTIKQRQAGALESGMWVESDQGVGVYLVEKSAPWVHLVNADGTTLAQLPADRCNGLRIARKASIPAVRVAHLADDALAALGYD